MGRPRKPPGDPLEGRISGKVKVNSKTYGTHYRARRGSVNEAKLNETMQKVNKLTLSTNAPAKLIHDALQPFRQNFKGGLFYQRLQKHFNAQARKGQKFSITDFLSARPELIERMENNKHIKNSQNKWWLNQVSENINKNYPASGMFDTMSVEVNIDMPNLLMQVSVWHKMLPKFLTDRPYVDGLQLTFIVLFPDFEDNHVDVESVILPIRKPDDTDTFSFMMNIPVTANSYMLFWKAEGTQNGVVRNSEASKSMVIQLVGKLP